MAAGVSDFAKLVKKWNPFLWLAWFLNRVFWCGLNERTVLGLACNFAVNFSPIFVWLLMFKNAGVIPKSWRPPILVKAAVRMNEVVFDVRKHPFLAPLCFALLVLMAFLLYKYIYQDRIHAKATIFEDRELQLEESPETFELSPQSSDSDSLSDSLSLDSSSSDSEFAIEEQKGGNTVTVSTDADTPSQLLNCWTLSPLFLLALSWPLLNFDMLFIHKQTPVKDIMAWASYVPGHAFVAIITAVWLYVFHPPGAVKIFSFMMGLQNIMAVVTHMLFPCAPPWFIHMYGEEHEANYDMEGYAAGLTRVDMAMGTHLHTNGFHKSPIVFGAIPSVHSAMAVMVFYFVSYFSCLTATKLLALSFVIYQWWATMYLDHHWRIDLLVGMFYSLFSYTIFLFSRRYGLQSIVDKFIMARRTHDFKKGSTMGMRVFRHTRIRDWFDPLK